MGKVYLINAYGTDLYKIGITTGNVEKRIKQLKTGNPYELTLVNVFECEYHRKVESWMHKRYSNQREEGEWFTLKDENVFSFINDCEQAHNTIKLLLEQNPFYK